MPEFQHHDRAQCNVKPINSPAAPEGPGPRVVRPRPGSRAAASKRPIVLAVACMLLVGWVWFGERMLLITCGQTVSASVVGFHTSKIKRYRTYYVDYLYDVGGQQRTGNQEVDFANYGRWNVGQTVQVKRMAIAGIEMNVFMNDRTYWWFWTWIAAGLGTVLTIIAGVVVYIKVIKPARGRRIVERGMRDPSS